MQILPIGGKTVTKLVTPEGKDTKLFHIVSLLTGWKNSLKGVGYFLGSALLEVSYEAALWSMIALVLIALPFAIFGLSKDLGTAKTTNATWREIFVTDNWNLNVLSFARMFLFASRDFWFEVPVSIFCDLHLIEVLTLLIFVCMFSLLPTATVLSSKSKLQRPWT